MICSTNPTLTVTLCLGSSCHSRGNRHLTETVSRWKESRKTEVNILFNGSLCLGRCNEGPLALINGKLERITDEAALLAALDMALPVAGGRE